MTRKVVVITAGLSVPSSTRLLADQLGGAVEAAVSGRGEDVKYDVIELRELATELAQAMVTGGIPTPAISAAKEAVAQADGIIAVTPVFAASYSGLFKMFIDILDPDSLNGIPVLIAATAGTARHSLVLDFAMRPLFTYLRANVIPTGVFAATEDFGSTGLTDRINRAAGEFASALVTTSVAGFTPAQDRRSGNDVGDVTPFEQLLAGLDGTG
ncbi:FMN reductase [Smaragdicoccus niigatensis]|uniref:FMN reductase n=1 Tax=Smaragdicoccus niigatensis TaxID=359359 RepID=UPI00036F8858|nr:FMN reductase [Smaragdicoccus niigatensis]